MENLKKTLEQLGLDEKESVVYFQALQLGGATASDIARRAGNKRSTVYLKLHSLNYKGLIDISKTKTRTLYRAVSPNRLVQLAEYRKKQIEEALPDLMTIYKEDVNKPRIQTLEGRQALDQMYRELFKELKYGEEVLIFGTVVHGEDKYRADMELWLETLAKKKIRTREIINKNESEREYVKRSRKNPRQEIRTISSNDFFSDNFIYRNKMIMFSVKKNLYVTVIEDENIVVSYRKLFELAWSSLEAL